MTEVCVYVRDEETEKAFLDGKYLEKMKDEGISFKVFMCSWLETKKIVFVSYPHDIGNDFVDVNPLEGNGFPKVSVPFEVCA